MLRSRKRLLFVFSAAGLFCILWPLLSPSLRAQLSTADHLAEPGFWPTQEASSRKDYLGSSACAPCHGAIVASQKATPMGGTALRADDAGILHSHPQMTFDVDKYHYQIKTDGTHSVYTVTDGDRTLTANLLWAFGTGRVGQSYLFKQDDGNFYEARVTYFDTLKDLHFTPGRALTSAKNLEEAMYRPVGSTEIGQCFACHATAPNIDNRLDEKNLVPGITCEACHGPGAKHVAAMQAAKLAGTTPAGVATIFNPAQLNPMDSVDFCGACHSTWWDVKLANGSGVSDVKSQPYRLEGSKCWGKGDARLTCVACHNPHQQVQAEPSSYDRNCLSCHVASATTKKTADHPGAACPVSTQNCVSCHMPKVFVPEMHYNFTDHRIRIARPNEPYPD
jgi:Cytochrome c554 and c-prime